MGDRRQAVKSRKKGGGKGGQRHAAGKIKKTENALYTNVFRRV